MSDRHSLIVDLIKYPILIFSILIALVAAKYLLGLEFGVVTEVGTGGVKFAEKSQATFEALTNLEGKVNQALVELEQLKKTSHSAAESPEIKAKLFEAAQIVSDQTAKVEQIQLPDPARRGRLKGYIWIGNFKQTWSGPKLAQPNTGQPISLPPSELQRGTEYIVLGNMVVRDGPPANDQSYYRGRNSLGVIPQGTRVRLVTEPIARDREYAVQYWAEVEVF
jgi:hypothetical protein